MTRITTVFEDDEPLVLDAPIDEVTELGLIDADDEVIERDATDDDAEMVITLDGEDTPIEPVVTEHSSVINTLRKRLREQGKELAARRATEPVREETLPPIPPMPTIEAFDYDGDAFAVAVERRADLVAAHRVQQARAQEAQQAAVDAYNAELASYQAKAKALRVPDFEDAEDAIREGLNVTQQTVLVKYASNPALVAYALGKRPAKLAELSRIDDPVRFAVAMADFEKGIKMQARKPSTAPETIVRGTAPAATPGPDKMLEKLERDAERTGDRTAIVRYKAQLKAKAQR